MSAYRTYRKAAENAARIGNNAAALEFSAKASAEKWVFPQDWSPGRCLNGIELPGADLSNVKTWPTKAAAQDGARAIGWPVGEVTKVRNRIHGQRWALVDGRWGLLSASAWSGAFQSR